MNILFYYPDKERAISLSTLMIEFARQGHTVTLLTHAEEGPLHEEVKKHGVRTVTHRVSKKNALAFYFNHIRFLAAFVKKERIDLVYSHIQVANFISVFASLFCKARFLLCRHHSDCAYLDNNRREKLFDKAINALGKEFIVPSQKVYDQMVKVEKVRNKKIYLIRYAYDFSTYPSPDPGTVDRIRQTYAAKLLLVKVARLIPEKRHLVMFNAIKRLAAKGLDVKLLVLSDGPLRDVLAGHIVENQLQKHIFMLGYKTDVMNYIGAADAVVHVSQSEASSNLAKEVGLLKKPLILCHDVGDFSEYLEDGVHVKFVSKEDPSAELEALLTQFYNDRSILGGLGENLSKVVHERFSLRHILAAYNQFHS
jgi:L-malate glycosyltransferase